MRTSSLLVFIILVCSVQEIIVKLITHLYLQEIKAVCFFLAIA